MKARLCINRAEVEINATRSQGAGGQNVNKVSSAAHLRFDIQASSLPASIKDRLQALPDRRVGSDGMVVIKAQTHRSLPRNESDALARLQALLDLAQTPELPRKPTQPTHASRRRRLETKALRAVTKAGRQKPME